MNDVVMVWTAWFIDAINGPGLFALNVMYFFPPLLSHHQLSTLKTPERQYLRADKIIFS